jgi:Cyclophilin type peptidyl-prolyl cis-trans isomerase/CLD
MHPRKPWTRISFIFSLILNSVGGVFSFALLTQANTGIDTNGCQFFILCAPAEWLDGIHVGRVSLSSLDLSYPLELVDHTAVMFPLSNSFTIYFYPLDTHSHYPLTHSFTLPTHSLTHVIHSPTHTLSLFLSVWNSSNDDVR